MLATVKANLLLTEASPLWGWAGEAEDDALDTAADDTCQATDCYYGEQITDLVQGRAEYCFPKIYKVKGVSFLRSDGDLETPERNTVAAFTRSGGKWATAKPVQYPAEVLFTGMIKFRVSPVASATITGGLSVSGFALSTLPKSGRERHQWDLPDDECPLPQWAHSAVVLKLTAVMCQRLAAVDRSMLPLAADYERRWREACGELEAQATRAYQAL